MDKRFLVVVHASDRSRHPAWCVSGPRSWDLFVCHAGSDPHRFPPEGEGMVRIDRAGPRWPTLARLLADTREAWQRYDYVWLPADDLELDAGTIDHLFETAARQRLDYAQLRLDAADAGLDARAPLFSTALLSRALPGLDTNDPQALLEDWSRLIEDTGARAEIVERPQPAARPLAVPAAAAAPRPAPALSVVIPTFNRANILQRCLAQLAAQTLPPEHYEVIVVDDGSTDATPQLLDEAARGQGVVVLRQANLGPAVARNRALARARGALLLFLNDDALLQPRALEIHLAEHARRGPQAAVLGSFPMHPDFVRTTGPVGHCLDHSDLIFEYPFMQPDRPYGHRQFYTCNLSIGREFLLRHGGFDEGFVRMGAEDIELGMRLERDGCRVFYRPDCVAHHAHRLDAAGLARMFQFRGRGGVHVFMQHPEFSPHYAAMPLGRIDGFQALDRRLQPLLARLDAAITRYDAIEFGAAAARSTLSQASTGLDLSMLWTWADADVEQVLRTLIGNLERHAATAEAGGAPSLDEAAARVYPALQFVKWYHDTLGLLSSPEIRAYLGRGSRHADAAARLAA